MVAEKKEVFETCATCRFFDVEIAPYQPKKTRILKGKCRIYPPTKNDQPRVGEDDWCGKHEKGGPIIRKMEKGEWVEIMKAWKPVDLPLIDRDKL